MTSKRTLKKTINPAELKETDFTKSDLPEGPVVGAELTEYTKGRKPVYLKGVDDKVDKVFKALFRTEIVVPENLRAALTYLKGKLSHDKIDIEIVKIIADNIKNASKDHSKHDVIVQCINDYLSHESLEQLQREMISIEVEIEKSAFFEKKGSDSPKNYFDKLSKNVDEKIADWEKELKGSHHTCMMMLARLKAFWINDIYTLSQTSTFDTKKSMETAHKSIDEQYLQLFKLIKLFANIDTSSKKETEKEYMQTVLIHLIKNISLFPGVSVSEIQAKMKANLADYAKETSATLPELSKKFTKAAEKIIVVAAPSNKL
jgi:hypothetical protein